MKTALILALLFVTQCTSQGWLCSAPVLGEPVKCGTPTVRVVR